MLIIILLYFLIGSTCFGHYYAHHYDPGTVPRDSEVPEYFRVTPGSRNNSRVSGIPEPFWVTPGTCSPLSDSRNPEFSGWLLNPEFRVKPRIRISGWFLKVGVPVDSWIPRFRVNPESRNSSGWLLYLGTLTDGSGIPQRFRVTPGSLRVPVNLENQVSRRLRNLG